MKQDSRYRCFLQSVRKGTDFRLNDKQTLDFFNFRH